MADDRLGEVPYREQLAATKMLVDVALGAMGKTVAVSDVRKRLKQTLEVIRQTLPAEQANAVLREIGPIWQD